MTSRRRSLHSLHPAWLAAGSFAVFTMLTACEPTAEAAPAVGAASSATTVPVRDIPATRGEEIAVLTSPPIVPPPITRTHATRVTVNLEVIEKTMRLAEGAEYTFWTFGGTVPGSFIRVREGDRVVFRLKNNAKSTVPHNIDLHAVTGPGGGASASLTIPGHEMEFEFTALNPGLYVYHCATAPVPLHLSNGMYGLILVEPVGGLTEVDHEFYVMQSEFYTTGKTGLQMFDLEKGIAENPTFVVFNGSVGALTGEGSLKVKTGESVRLFVGNAGPNLVSSFHVIGEVFDNVYVEGGLSAIQHNVQTTLVPAGGATIVEFRAEAPGDLVIVDHSIFRAFNKGALGLITVTGPDNPKVFAGAAKSAAGGVH